MNSRMILVIFLVALVVLFIIQNIAMVKIQFLFWSIEMSRALFIFALLAIGVIIGWMLHEFMSHKKVTPKKSSP